MIKIFKRGFTYAVAAIGLLFTFIPEDIFAVIKLLPEKTANVNIVVNRTITFGIIFILTCFGYFLYLKLRKEVVIKGKNYRIRIRYDTIFALNEYKKVIPFDECFTTHVGNEIADINPTSLCGQYLKFHPIDDMTQLIEATGLDPLRRKSSFNNQECYESGRLIQRDDYLLMAFTRLDSRGAGVMSRPEYLQALSVLWEELDLYSGQNNICIPIIGSGVTRIGDNELTQQELLDMIIYSYKLSCRKIKLPNELCIVCRKIDDFSLDEY